MSYDQDYYESLNYSDYLSRANKYKGTAKELASSHESLSMITKESTLLDYGCAVGFLADALNRIGYNCHGYDISEWAKEQASLKDIKIVESLDHHYDCVFYLDVLEHMSDTQIRQVFSDIKSRHSIVRIPCSTDGGKTYHLKVSNQDPTHINCKTKDQWGTFFKSLGVKTIISLNTFTVYDSDGVMCALLIKE